MLFENKMMKSFLLFLLLFSSPVVAQEYAIYTRERPPFSISGIIDSDKTFYYFTNAAEPKCDIYAGESGKWCFMKTNVKAEIISKDVIKVANSYYCSEDHIQEVNKNNKGYGRCTKDGWNTKT